MKNETLYKSNYKPMRLQELKEFIDKLLNENPEFKDANVYMDCDGVVHLVEAVINENDMIRMSREKTFSIILMDEEAVEDEEEKRKKWTDKQKKEREEYF
jgi:hypothetical protein